MRQNLIDILGLAGVACIVAGCAMIYTPLAWLVGGSLAVCVSIMGAKRWA